MRTLASITRLARAIRARPRTTIGIVAAIGVAALVWHATTARTPVRSVSLPVRVAQPRVKPTQPVSFEEGCMTAECHGALDKAVHVHAPLNNDACGSCHAPDAGDHRFPLVSPAPGLCTSCHNARAEHRFEHHALTNDSCLACHQPHSGPTESLLNQPSLQETCRTCHHDTEGKTLHPPYAAKQCDLCHDPHGSNANGLLRADSTESACGACHPKVVDAMNALSHSHRAAEGACLACHAPHASSADKLLSAPPRELCTSCHAEVDAAISGALVTHEPIVRGEQCVRCHDPHASSNRGMLRESEQTLCLSCHNTAQAAADGRTLPAMKAHAATSPLRGHESCSNCHSVHGATHGRLLRDKNSSVPMGAYDRTNYALCFSCHDAKLASSASATQFRDGDRNLHEVHLSRGERSLGCAACHAVHADGEPRLIARSVNFEGSGWMMPLTFTLTPTGGRCATSCHETLDYNRRPTKTPSSTNGGAP